MMHFFDIGVRAGNACSDFRKCARQVANFHGESCKLTGPDQPAFYDLREHEQIDVSAAQHKSTCLPAKRWGDSISAARPAAPAPSDTVFSTSSKSTIAFSSAPSLTSTISSTSLRTIGSVSLPGLPTAMPSAIVLGPKAAGASRTA